MSADALHTLLISSIEGMRNDMSELRREVASVRSEISSVREDGSERGRRQWEQMNRHQELLTKLDGRMEKVENDVATAKPTLTEYSNLKLRAEGAGWLGRKLWILATVTISGAAWVYASWDKVVYWTKALMR
jgi:Protein of unknown function (DUF1515).